MSLRAKKLTAQQTVNLWREFYEAHGPEVMARAYGWESPECRQRRKGEHVWAFYDRVVPTPLTDTSIPGRDVPLYEMGLVGWGSCCLNLNDPDDNEATFVVGVFPLFQRQGVRRMILDWMSEWAKAKGASYASLIVFAENEENHARHHREADDENSPWVWAGDVWFPEAYSIFVRDLTEPEKEAVA